MCLFAGLFSLKRRYTVEQTALGPRKVPASIALRRDRPEKTDQSWKTLAMFQLRRSRAFCSGLFCLFVLLAFGLVSSAPLHAGDDTTTEVWENKLQDLEAEVQQLRRLVEQQQAAPVYASPGVASLCPPTEPCLDLGPDYPTIDVTGFFQADVGWVSQSETNRAAVGDVQDGADFRRARLAAKGAVADNVSYMIEFDFAFPGRPSFMDVWLKVHDTYWFDDVTVGHFRQPIGMDGQTSARELTFIERALPFAFLPFRQIGVMSSGFDEEAGRTWAYTVFRFPTDAWGGQIGDDGGYGFSTRQTALLVDHGDQGVVHIGGAFTMMDPANDAVQYRAQPEMFLAETGGAAFVPAGVPSTFPPFVDTGVIPTDQAYLFGGELATTQGSFHAQSELIYAVVNRQAASTVGFYGVYAQAGWILTGEHRPYKRDQGVLGRVKPARPFTRCGGTGAWELTGRWSHLNLNSDTVQGGRLTDLTFGLNWYLNDFTKFQFNYIHAFLDSPVNGDSNADILGMRAQVDF